MKKSVAFICLFLLLVTTYGFDAQKPATPIMAETEGPTPVSTIAPATEETAVDLDAYVGFYGNDDRDSVTIETTGDGYAMSVELYRLTGLEKGTVCASAEGIVFHTIDAAENPMVVSFYPDGEGYALRVEESTWPLLEQGTIIGGFKRTMPKASTVEGDPVDAPDTPLGHYVFQPKVCSLYMEELFGKTMCETWFNLVDAVMAGKNTFACPDQHTYDWVMGQFPERCFPVLTELIDYAWDREHSVKDGVASFTYLMPVDEAAARIKEFGTMIENILNQVLEDDYSDMEKALALYDYFSRTYSYDYDTFGKMSDVYVDYTRSYRFFQTGIGICHEISTAYSYLLMQAGVEATIMMGSDHQWSYVRINGHDYHIDPTFAINNPGSLSYFMMTDEQRAATGYVKKEHIITSNYAQDHPHPDYVADDDTFQPLWNTNFEAFFHDTHTILCWAEKIGRAHV